LTLVPSISVGLRVCHLQSNLYGGPCPAANTCWLLCHLYGRLSCLCLVNLVKRSRITTRVGVQCCLVPSNFLGLRPTRTWCTKWSGASFCLFGLIRQCWTHLYSSLIVSLGMYVDVLWAGWILLWGSAWGSAYCDRTVRGNSLPSALFAMFTSLYLSFQYCFLFSWLCASPLYFGHELHLPLSGSEICVLLQRAGSHATLRPSLLIGQGV